MNRDDSAGTSLRLGRLFAVLGVLVVISIAISVLMPGLQKAKRLAREVSIDSRSDDWYTGAISTAVSRVPPGEGAPEKQKLSDAEVSVFDARIDLTPGLSVGTEQPESIYEANLSATLAARAADPTRACQIRLPIPPEIISLSELKVTVNGDPDESVGISGNELVWTGQLPADEDANVQITFDAVGKGIYVLKRPPGKIIDRFHTELVAHRSNIRMLELSLQPQSFGTDGNKTVYTWDYERLLLGRPIQIDVLGIAAVDRLGEIVWTAPASVILYGLLVVLATMAYRPARLDAWMTVLLVGCFAAAFPLMYFLQDFMPLWQAMSAALAAVLAIIAVRAITLFGLAMGIGAGVLLPGAIAALGLTMTIHTQPAVQGVCMTLLAILTVVLAMIFVPRAQQHIRDAAAAARPEPPKPPATTAAEASKT